MPILIPVAEGVIEGGEAVEAGVEGYEAYRTAQALKAAAKLAAAAKAAQLAHQGVQTDACSTCEPPEKDPKDPCKHLERGNGPGKYRGGSHREMTKPANDDLDSHHMPPAASIKGTLPRNDGAAIQMLPRDHEKTLSYGNSAQAQAYRAQQQRLIDSGEFSEAFANDAADARRVAARAGDPNRYDEAINEAQAYADCVKKNKL